MDKAIPKVTGHKLGNAAVDPVSDTPDESEISRLCEEVIASNGTSDLYCLATRMCHYSDDIVLVNKIFAAMFDPSMYSRLGLEDILAGFLVGKELKDVHREAEGIQHATGARTHVDALPPEKQTEKVRGLMEEFLIGLDSSGKDVLAELAWAFQNGISVPVDQDVAHDLYLQICYPEEWHCRYPLEKISEILGVESPY